MGRPVCEVKCKEGTEGGEEVMAVCRRRRWTLPYRKRLRSGGCGWEGHESDENKTKGRMSMTRSAMGLATGVERLDVGTVIRAIGKLRLGEARRQRRDAARLRQAVDKLRRELLELQVDLQGIRVVEADEDEEGRGEGLKIELVSSELGAGWTEQVE